MSHIREKLPDIKAKLNSLIGQTQQELSSYGDPTFTSKTHRVRMVFFFVRGGSTAYSTHIIDVMLICGISYCNRAH